MNEQNATPALLPASRQTGRGPFVERTLVNLARKMERALVAEKFAETDGFLQKLDPRVKVIALPALILSVTLARNFFTILIVFTLALGLAVGSKIPLRMLAARVWLNTCVFTGLLALPGLFITPGKVLWRLPLVHWAITAQGLTSAGYLMARVTTTATLSLLLILCTLWPHLLKALRVLHVPVVVVVILGLTHRYIFVLLETAQNMLEARKSRLVGPLRGSEKRRLAAASIGVLLSKSLSWHNEIYLAMQSRGFRGEVYTLDDFVMTRCDWCALFGFLLISSATCWLGRQDSLAALL